MKPKQLTKTSKSQFDLRDKKDQGKSPFFMLIEKNPMDLWHLQQLILAKHLY